MTQNLRLVGPLTLNSTYSDMTSGSFSLPASAGGQWASGYSDYRGANTLHVYDTGNTTYGAFYNWHTAVAATMNYDSTSGIASASICPKNWRLPVGAGGLSTNDFQVLYNAYGSAASFISATGAPLAGFFSYSGTIVNQGTNGYWHAADAHAGGRYAWYLRYSSSEVITNNGGDKVNGYSVRCVAR